jgi:hypothetical protein
MAQEVGTRLGERSLLLQQVPESRKIVSMATLTLVTSVHLSKAEALDVLSNTLSAPWVIDDPSEVTLALPQGVVLSIEVPKFGEDLPLTLDCHHEDSMILEGVAQDITATIESTLGWRVDRIR